MGHHVRSSKLLIASGTLARRRDEIVTDTKGFVHEWLLSWCKTQITTLAQEAKTGVPIPMATSFSYTPSREQTGAPPAAFSVGKCGKSRAASVDYHAPSSIYALDMPVGDRMMVVKAARAV